MSANATDAGSLAPAGGGDVVDPCDLRFDVALTGVRPDVLATVAPGNELEVVLRRAGNFEAAVCTRRTDDAVLGSLSSVEDLDLLLRCLREGKRYLAVVVATERAGCRVHVERARP